MSEQLAAPSASAHEHTEPPEGLSELVLQILANSETNQYTVGRPRNDTEAAAICDRLARSGAIPKAYVGKPGDIYAVMIAGQRFGWDVMQSMMAFACIKGAPRLWGDAAHAVFLRANKKRIEELYERPPHIAIAKEEGLFRVKWKGSPECQKLDDGGCKTGENNSGCCIVRRFSKKDAEAAGLWMRESGTGEAMPWKAYAGRMLQMRPRSWGERDADPQAFCGFGIAEEVLDLERLKKLNAALSLGAPKAKAQPEATEANAAEITKVLTRRPAPQAVQPPPVEQPKLLRWTGQLKAASRKKDTTPQQYALKHEAGEFLTLDEPTAKRGKEYASAGDVVVVEYEETKLGKEIRSLAPAQQPPAQREPGADEEAVL